MGKPGLTVSVVTPSYNHAPYLRAAIDSVLHQDCPDVEYVVVDGGSKDGTVDILRQYGQKLRWVSEPDDGQSSAINKGFARISGDIVGWLNSDDTYEPGALKTVIDYFNAHPDIDVVYGQANFIDAHGKHVCPCAHIEPHNVNRLMHHSDYIVQPAAFFRRQVLMDVGGVDPNLHWAMDYDLWIKLSKRARFAYIPQTLANFRWIGTNKTEMGGRSRFEEIELIARRNGIEGLPSLFRLEVVRLCAIEALAALRRRDFGHIGRCIGEGARAMYCVHPWIALCRPQTWRIIWTAWHLRRKTRHVVPPGPANAGNDFATHLAGGLS